MGEWIAVDLDGTLMAWTANGHIMGPPIPNMVNRVKLWLAQGKEVKIFTARASTKDITKREANINAIQAWCETHIGQKLPVTCEKDLYCVQIWDDKAVRVIRNSGLSEYEYNKRKGTHYGSIRKRTKR